eukprot:s117_g39.t1
MTSAGGFLHIELYCRDVLKFAEAFLDRSQIGMQRTAPRSLNDLQPSEAHMSLEDCNKKVLDESFFMRGFATVRQLQEETGVAYTVSTGQVLRNEDLATLHPCPGDASILPARCGSWPWCPQREFKATAEAFVRAHPGVPARGLTRSERLLVPGAKEAFAVVTARAEHQTRLLGGEPCDRSPCPQMASSTSQPSCGALAETETDAALLELFAGLQPVLWKAVEDLGVQTCSDLAHLWTSSTAFCQDLETNLGDRFPKGEVFQLAHVWVKARRIAQQRRDTLATSLVALRHSSVGPPLKRSQTPAEPPSTSVPGKVRRMLVTGLPVAGAALTTAAAAADPWAKEEATKALKLDQLFQLVMEDVIDLAELGQNWDRLADPVRLQAFKETLMASASRLSGARLGALISAFRRWRRFCQARTYDVRCPSPLMVAEFLQEVSRGGPTAAASMHATFKWYSMAFGAVFHVDHFLVKPYRFHAVTHSGKQAPELEPWEFMNLCLLMGQARGTHKVLLAFMVMAAVGCIRFEHLQRSTLEANHEKYLEFKCSQGKARTGVQVVLQGQRLLCTLWDFYHHELPGTSFLLPAVQLAPDDFWELTEHSAFITNRKMSRARFLELFRGALMAAGTEVEKAQTATFNRLRRFLPTLANTMELSTLELQAIGSWVEVPDGGGRDPQRQKDKAVLSMGVHYAAAKVLRSAQVKQRCVDRLLSLFHRKRGELALTHKGLLCRDAWSWQEVAALHQMFPETEVPEPLNVEELRKPDLELPPEPPTADAAAPGGLEPLVSDSESSISESTSGQTSSSASDISADGEELVGVLPDESAAENLAWMKQSKKIHLVREECDGRLTPWCRDGPFAQDPTGRGHGFTVSSKEQFCQRCLARLPRGLYVALAEHCGWVF